MALRQWIYKLALLPCAAILLLPIATAQEAAPPKPAPPDYTAPLNDARQMIGTGAYVEAEKALRALLAQAPELADAHSLLGFTMLHEGKAAESLNEYTAGAKLHEPGTDELTGVALDYIRLKDLPDAEKWLIDAARKSPERALVWYLLGRTQFELGHAADAAKSLQTCLKIDPQNIRAQYNLGRVYELLKQPEAAVEAYQKAISLQTNASSKDASPYLYLGMLLRRQGKAKDAAPLLKTAMDLNASNRMAPRELGLAYESLGRYNEAAWALKKAIDLDPGDTSLHFFLGRVDREGGQMTESEKEFSLAAGSPAKP